MVFLESRDGWRLGEGLPCKSCKKPATATELTPKQKKRGGELEGKIHFPPALLIFCRSSIAQTLEKSGHKAWMRLFSGINLQGIHSRAKKTGKWVDVRRNMRKTRTLPMFL